MIASVDSIRYGSPLLLSIIRPATADDLPAITAIYNHAILHTTATFDHRTEDGSRATGVVRHP
jgi:phosphinothricin acetyltransferase